MKRYGHIRDRCTRWFWLLGLCLLLTVTGCIDLTNLGGSAPDECRPDGLLFADTFDGSEQCGWALYSQGGASVDISNGALRIGTSQIGEIWWTNPGRRFDDVIITAVARQTSGPDNNAYGVICRYQNESNFYIFLISGDGYYAIGKYQSGSDRIIYLTEDGQYQFSDIINQGIATNQIRVGCIGNELSLAVNGIPLLNVTDSAFATGDVGLGVSTLAAGTAVVEFNSIRIMEP
jgi:hypothetical protein